MSISAIALIGAFISLLPRDAMSRAEAANRAQVEVLAQQLVALRSEVDALNTQVAMRSEAGRTRLRELEAQRADLQLHMQRESMRRQQLQQTLAELQQAHRADTGFAAQLKPVLLACLGRLRSYVDNGLPFAREQRLEAVENIRAGLANDSLPAPRAVSQVWQLIEDELRLGGENELHRQVITLAGREVLADVARLGMVALFFRTFDGSVGQAMQRDGGWTYVPEPTHDGRRRIAQLFEAFEKNVRVGAFALPIAPATFPTEMAHGYAPARR